MANKKIGETGVPEMNTQLGAGSNEPRTLAGPGYGGKVYKGSRPKKG